MTNSSVCVDANVVIWSLVPFPLSDSAAALMAKWRAARTQLVAPALLAFEVTAMLRRLVHLQELTVAEGERALAQFLRLELRLSHRKAIFPLAWQLARDYDRPRAYDTAYLAVAQLQQCEFWTADKRLYNAVSPELDWVRWVGHFDPGSEL